MRVLRADAQESSPSVAESLAAVDGHASVDDHDMMAEEFFSARRPAVVPEVWDEEFSPAPMSGSAARAMLATFGMLGLCVCGLFVYMLYQQWFMPEPVELGGLSGVELPAVPVPVPAPAPAVSVPVPVPVSVSASVPVSVAVPAAVVQPLRATPPVQARAPVPVAGPSYEDLVGVGRALGQSGQAAAAIDAYEHALLLRPDTAEPLARIANLHLNAGKAAEARSYAARAVIADPTSSEGWIVLGAAEASLGNQAASHAAYRNCAALGVGVYLRECRQLAR
jgi:hypothetical protein